LYAERSAINLKEWLGADNCLYSKINFKPPRAKGNISRRRKPETILALEKALGIKIERLETPEDVHGNPMENSANFYTDPRGVVTGLYLDGAGLEDISFLSKFKDLEYLSLNNNDFEDIPVLRNLRSLKQLAMVRNGVRDLSALSELALLEDLYLSENPIKDISQISGLVKLSALACGGLGIDNVDFLLPLKNLKYLDLWGNYRIENISVLSDLKELVGLDLGFNNVKDVTPLEYCPSLLRVGLHYNKIKNIPVSLAKRFNWNVVQEVDYSVDLGGVYLEVPGNPLQLPPLSVVSLGLETVREYYRSAERNGHAPLSEGRIIVIGDGAAGKSSLVERLLHDRFEQGKAQTNGIRIDNWMIDHADGRELTLHFWDFGGQEIQHAVHKFFFTSGCLYVLVLDNRKEEDPEYWLQQVTTLGGSAPVLVVFNKQDENVTEIVDRKFLQEKYKNIVGFFNVSCKTGYGVDEFRNSLAANSMKLNTIDEQFPNNWFEIKRAIETHTSGAKNYLDYKEYQDISTAHQVTDKEIQTLLLKYLTTIGAVTWFGDTYLNFLRVLSPEWIAQGVYKIITGRRTAEAAGKISIGDFPGLLAPRGPSDYTYEESHFGYILTMMKKFELCYVREDGVILIPSAFGKMPKVEYSEFKGLGVRTYFLQFKEYMPIALIHRFATKKLPMVYGDNYWYTGIVIRDLKSNSLAMVHADREAKRIYIRIKGEEALGVWEHTRREIDEIAGSYASIPYEELVQIGETEDSAVSYRDLVNFLKSGKATYFHAGLRREFNVGYLLSLFEEKGDTVHKIEKEDSQRMTLASERSVDKTIILNILNNISPTISSSVNVSVTIDIDIQVVNELGSELKGDVGYLIEELGSTNQVLTEALHKLAEFADDAKAARNKGDLKEKGWGRRLKNVIKTVAGGGEQLKHIQEGQETLKSILHWVEELAKNFHLQDIVTFLHTLI